MILSKRLDGVSESATLKLNAMVQAMKLQGIDVVNLTAGEPDFFVPQEAKDAVIEALKANQSKYTPVAGILALRDLVAQKTNRQQPGLEAAWTAADVVVSNGGKQAIFNTFLALLDAGDEVLIPAPYWLSYPEMTKLAGAKPRVIETRIEKGYKVTPDLLKAAIEASRDPSTAKCRAKIIVFNSPSNPTGATYTKQEYRALGEVLGNTPGADRIWVVSDEIYDKIMFDGNPFCSFLDACPELQSRTVTVNGLSKSGAMTGWRIGWSVAPETVTQGIATLQGQSTSGINALAQWAAMAALRLPEELFLKNQESFHRRRDLALEILKKAAKIKISRPGGAFYFFLEVGECLRAGEDSIGLAERILQEAKVAVVPGAPFGGRDAIRLSFATDEASLKEGCERLVSYLNR